MRGNKWLWTLLAGLLFLGCLQMIYYYPQLPERLATHFDARGAPDGWSSKNGYLRGQIILAFTVGGIFPLLLGLMPYFPVSWVNLPNKEYWLGPERRDFTLGWISDFLLLMASLTVAFFLGLNQIIIRLNLSGQPALGTPFWILLGGFLLAMGILTLRFMLRFRRSLL